MVTAQNKLLILLGGTHQHYSLQDNIPNIPKYEDLLLYENNKFQVNIDGCLYGIISRTCKDVFEKVKKDGQDQSAQNVFTCWYNTERNLAITDFRTPDENWLLITIMLCIPLTCFFVSFACLVVCSITLDVSLFKVLAR